MPEPQSYPTGKRYPQERIRALEVLHSRGIKTFAMIAPILPRSRELIEQLPGRVDHVLIDRLNYAYANRIYEKHNLKWAREDAFFLHKADELKEGLCRQNIPVQVLF